MVLVVALVLVGAAVGLLFVGRANTGNYILALLAILVDRRGVLAVRAGLRHPPLCRQGYRQSADPRGGRRRLRRHCGHRCQRPRDVCQRGLSGADRRRRREGRAAGRARVHRRPGCVGSGLSPAESRARRPPPAGGGARRRAATARPARWLRMRVRPLRGRQEVAQLHGLEHRRRHARPREAGKRLPGIAARDRLSRPCAGRILLGRCQGRRGLSQCHARDLARSRSRVRSAPAG